MANHVNTYVSFYRISEEGEKKLDELYHRLENFGEENTYDYAAEMFFGVPRPEGEDNTDGPGYFSWNIEHMGAKWCTLEDPDPSGFRLTSAWSVPWDLINYVSEEIQKVDPDVFVTVDYEDEMPNFVGWATWHDGSYDEGREWEWENMVEWMRDNNEELAAMWDEEAEDWIEDKEDEARDLQWDMQMEFFEMVKDQTLTEEVNWYMEHEEEIKAELAEEENGTV